MPSKPPPGYEIEPDPGLTAETQLSLEHAPYPVRQWLNIPAIKAYKATTPPNAAESTGGAPPIAGVRNGDTNAIQVYRPESYVTAPDGSSSTQLPIHEATHLVQNIMEKLHSANFPADDQADPYKDMRLTADDLTALRAKGDTLGKHSREGQASILQAYEARKDWLENKATPQQKQEYLNSTGQFSGNGNAEFESSYGPYAEEFDAIQLPKGSYRANVEQTPMKPPPLLPSGYTLEK